jgi:hypothetical protein
MRQLINVLRAKFGQAILGIACVIVIASVVPLPAHSAERDICENMTGEQLRRCIENAAREPPAQPQRPINVSPSTAQSAAPAHPPNTGVPTAAQPIARPGAPGTTAAAVAEPSKALQRLNCTKVPQPDQPLCVHRNTALIECGTRGRYPDYDKCLEDIMSRAPNPVTADCAALPESQKAICMRRNKVYAACKDNKLSYFACLEQRMGAQK